MSADCVHVWRTSLAMNEITEPAPGDGGGVSAASISAPRQDCEPAPGDGGGVSAASISACRSGSLSYTIVHGVSDYYVISRRVTNLRGRCVLLRPIESGDFEAWREVRRHNKAWLSKWEPRPAPGAPDVIEDRRAFGARCLARRRERQTGTGYGFGLFVDTRFAGEVNLNSIQRGPFQNAYVGYWIDERFAGRGYMPEALVMVLRFAFQELQLHRVQAAIVPRNKASLRVVEKLGLRAEGTALRYLEIAGVWEDHIRFGITVEDWAECGSRLIDTWIRS